MEEQPAGLIEEHQMEFEIETTDSTMDEEPVKKKPIKIAADVLRELIAWIPLEDLPKVNTANRRLWLFCDDDLEERKYLIQPLCLSSDFGLEVSRRNVGRVPKTVKFAKVEPPSKFELTALYLPETLSRRAMQFLRIAKPLFTRAVFRWNFNRMKIGSGIEKADQFLEIFDRCPEIVIFNLKPDLTRELFAKDSVRRCTLHSDCGFDPSIVFDWLHSVQQPSAGKRQISLETDSTPIFLPFFASIIKKFSEDDTKHSFALIFRRKYPNDIMEDFRMENQRTGQVLFSRTNSFSCRSLVRCNKEDELSAKLSLYNAGIAKNLPKIKIGDRPTFLRKY